MLTRSALLGLASVFAAGVALGLLAGERRARPEALDGGPQPERVLAAGRTPPMAELSEPRIPAPLDSDSAGRDEGEPGRRIARRAEASTVLVNAGELYGSGLRVTRHYVLTCLHVLRGTKSAKVSFADQRASDAKLVDADRALDLVVLRLSDEPLPGATEAVELAPRASVSTGDTVFAMGMPRKMLFSFSRGVVSFASRSFEGVDYVQTDLAINEGNSGGPLFDARGRVIGIISFILRDSQGLAFALPIEAAFQRFPEYFREGREHGARPAH